MLLLAFTAFLCADPAARMECRRARADFDVSADPASPHWKRAKAVQASVDPFGKPAGANAFTFRTLWTPENLYFLFECPYDSLNLKKDPSTSTETNRLWEWDVTEVFIGWDPDNIGQYKELQVSPQGEWVDLDIDRSHPKPEGGWKWNSGMTVKARIDSRAKVWYGEMKIPFRALDPRPPQAGHELRINVYRLAGAPPSRQSIMWTPTQARSHHTPAQFGRMVLTR